MERAGLKKWVLETAVCRTGADGCVVLGDKLPPGFIEGKIGGASFAARGWLCVRTGGSSGAAKFARHDELSVGAAVEGFQKHFSAERVNALGLLPEEHVSGFMARARCLLSGGVFLRGDWREVERGIFPEVGEGFFVSLVPTQLQRLLKSAAARDWLRRFRAVLVGGGPAWADLLEEAAACRVPLAPSYGMTESAAMVTALRPEEFLSGRRGCGSVLPHARVVVGDDGGLSVGGGSLFRGYWPDFSEPGPDGLWKTSDAGFFDEGSLVVRGRVDAVIISGGKKISPEEVEAAARASGAVEDVAVVGLPDAEWGERVVLCYPAGRGDAGRLREFLAERLEGFKRPKDFVPVERWPRDEKGKLDRKKLREDVAGSSG